jgi:amidohydrolase
MQLGKIKELAARHYNETVENRRHLHRHPELSFHERETAAFISRKLDEYGIQHQGNVGGHGIVAIIRGRNAEGACMALRADMDALPIKEAATHAYSSLNHGVMHACGHDAHSAMLLTAGRILTQMNQHYNGEIKLIFQPAEEILPGGAKGMIDAGVLKNPEVQAITAQHVLPSLECGKIGIRPGQCMASGDEIDIRVTGTGGHAALPNSINDTVLIASQIVVSLQQVVSRFAPPMVPTVLSFGRFIADGFHNVIPAEVIIQGTLRTFDEIWREQAKEHIKRIACKIAEAHGAQAEVMINNGYPVLMNNQLLCGLAMDAAIEYVGRDNVVEMEQRMTTEDFAHYSQHIPACFYRLGTGSIKKGISAGLHSPHFDIDEGCLETGSGLMAWIALNQLKSLNNI